MVARFLGRVVKKSYYDQAVANLIRAESQGQMVMDV